MADDFDEEDVVDEESEEGGGKSRSGMLIILIVGALIVVAGAIAAYFIFARSSGGGDGTAPASKGAEVAAQDDFKAPTGDPIWYEVGDIYINIAGTRSTRVLKFTPKFELSEERMTAELDKYKPMLKDNIATIARHMTFDELEGPNGPEMLKDQIRDQINRALSARLGGGIVAVHFEDFLIQ